MNEPKILGVNRRHYPTQVGEVRTVLEDLNLGAIGGWSCMPPCTTAVLVEGDIGDYACYVGHGTPSWVAQNGDKVSFFEAKANFPGIEEEKYRS